MPLAQESKTDFRIYIGIILFRWQFVVLCFLTALLGAVLYLNWATPIYQTTCKILVHKDENLEAPTPNSPWGNFSSHTYLLGSPMIRNRAAERLKEDWEIEMGGFESMVLAVGAAPVHGVRFSLQVTVESPKSGYNEAFLSNVVAVHQEEWLNIQSEGENKAIEALERELLRLEGQIREGENAVSDYRRIHDIIRATARQTMEVRYLEALMSRKSGLLTEAMLMEAQNPLLKNQNAAVISDVLDITRETGKTRPAPPDREFRMGADGLIVESSDGADSRSPKLPDQLESDGPDIQSQEVMAGLMELRVTLAGLQARDKELAEKFKPEHPELLATRKEIARIENQLGLAANMQLERLQDRYKALKISLDALERAEYNWKARSVLATEKGSELKRLEDVVARYQRYHSSLYEKLQQLRVNQELEADRFHFLEPITTNPRPIWPDYAKVLLAAMAIGLGAGLGLVILAHFTDNRVQTIRDVESELGVPFLGGVPFWAGSGLEDTVRPIVTERDSLGAVEAYRSVRTSVLSALNKRYAKLVIFTSADSKEGKTLTALNLAVTTAQMERKVLLVDMDLRRGRLHKSLGVDKAPGFSGVLRGETTVDTAIRSTRIKNLDFLSAGEPVENAAELLHAVDLKQIMHELAKRYDYVMVDTSPVLRVTDTVIAAAEMGAVVLFVAHVNRTPKPMIRYALSLLKDVDVAGIIMNGIEMHRIGSLYYAYQYPNYAYYSNAYRYGYDYAYGDNPGGHSGRTPRNGASGGGMMDRLRRLFRSSESGR